MSRQINTHQVNECNSAIAISVLDEPGSGGACHQYYLTWPGSSGQPSGATQIVFQNGPIAEVGTNGLTHEALLAIVVDRLEGFQTGPYACRENAIALTKLQEAQHWLNHRTQQRLARGVEGTHNI